VATGRSTGSRTPLRVGIGDNRSMKRSIAIIDDNPGFRASARRMLEDQGYVVDAEAADGSSGVAAVEGSGVEIAIVDIQLPDFDGFEVARRICEDEAPPAVVLTSSRDRADFGSLVDGSPALGFVPKSELSVERVEALIA
jgi:DNA-binding NarL/FixJ family response regulator